MSDFSKAKLPENLPQCACFQVSDEQVWDRCGDIAEINNAMCGAFHQLTTFKNLCPSALMFTMTNAITTLLAYIAKAGNHSLEYGSAEIEAETERLLKGLEERVLAGNRYSYEVARKYNLTEESVNAMLEGSGKTKQ